MKAAAAAVAACPPPGIHKIMWELSLSHAPSARGTVAPPPRHAGPARSLVPAARLYIWVAVGREALFDIRRAVGEVGRCGG